MPASGRCSKCGTWRESLHKDHIVPKWSGGADEPSNWQRLCANCHEDKTLAEHRSQAYRALVSAKSSARKWTDAQRQAQSARQVGRKRGPYTNKKGPLTIEQRERIRASWTPERRELARARMTGKVFGPCSPEVRAKISAARKGKKMPAWFGAKMSAVMRGKPRPHSETHKANLRAAAARRRERLAARSL